MERTGGAHAPTPGFKKRGKKNRGKASRTSTLTTTATTTTDAATTGGTTSPVEPGNKKRKPKHATTTEEQHTIQNPNKEDEAAAAASTPKKKASKKELNEDEEAAGQTPKKATQKEANEDQEPPAPAGKKKVAKKETNEDEEPAAPAAKKQGAKKEANENEESASPAGKKAAKKEADQEEEAPKPAKKNSAVKVTKEDEEEGEEKKKPKKEGDDGAESETGKKKTNAKKDATKKETVKKDSQSGSEVNSERIPEKDQPMTIQSKSVYAANANAAAPTASSGDAVEKTVIIKGETPEETVYSTTDANNAETNKQYLMNLIEIAKKYNQLVKEYENCGKDGNEVNTELKIEIEKLKKIIGESEARACAYFRIAENIMKKTDPLVLSSAESKLVAKDIKYLGTKLNEMDFLGLKKARNILETEFNQHDHNWEYEADGKKEQFNGAKFFKIQGPPWILPIPTFVHFDQENLEAITLMNFTSRAVLIKMRITSPDNFHFKPIITFLGPYQIATTQCRFVGNLPMKCPWEKLTVYWHDYDAVQVIRKHNKQEFSIKDHFMGKISMAIMVDNWERKEPIKESTKYKKDTLKYLWFVKDQIKTLKMEGDYYDKNTDDRCAEEKRIAKLRGDFTFDDKREAEIKRMAKRLDDLEMKRFKLIDQTLPLLYRKVNMDEMIDSLIMSKVGKEEAKKLEDEKLKGKREENIEKPKGEDATKKKEIKKEGEEADDGKKKKQTKEEEGESEKKKKNETGDEKKKEKPAEEEEEELAMKKPDEEKEEPESTKKKKKSDEDEEENNNKKKIITATTEGEEKKKEETETPKKKKKKVTKETVDEDEEEEEDDETEKRKKKKKKKKKAKKKKGKKK